MQFNSQSEHLEASRGIRNSREPQNYITFNKLQNPKRKKKEQRNVKIRRSLINRQR